MEMSMYNLIYIITSVLGTYIIFKFMDIFFNRKDANKIIELCSYIAHYIFLTLVYLYINVPIIVFICNIISFLCLSLNYKAGIKKRILAIVFIYLILVCVEITVVIALSGFHFLLFSKNEYKLAYTLIVVKVVSYLVVIILNKCKNIRNGEKVPFSYWICILLIPVSSLYIILVFFRNKNIMISDLVISIILIFLINFVAFYLYDVISATLTDRMSKLLLVQQNNYYDKQLNLMKTSLKATKAFKHDLKNHLLVLYSLVQNNDTEKSLKHISNMIQVIELDKKYARSGNVSIDSIINFKLQGINEKKIKVTLDIIVPEQLDIPSFDMTIILGNLLDNAIKAVNKMGEGFIDIMIKYDKGRLIFKINNTHNGEIVYEEGNYLTTQIDKSEHGLGLDSVKGVLSKYDGSLSIDHSNSAFLVTVLLYLE